MLIPLVIAIPETNPFWMQLLSIYTLRLQDRFILVHYGVDIIKPKI